MEGTRLSHFRVFSKVGEGGMGVVYKAEDEKLLRPVALKVLPPSLVGDEPRRRRFLREARAAAAVSHPNIGAVHEVGEDSGVVFIAMEYVEGKTLGEVMGGRALPVEKALDIVRQIAEGLEAAHRAGVIHRDLKPGNVMLQPDGRVRIGSWRRSTSWTGRTSARSTASSGAEPFPTRRRGMRWGESPTASTSRPSRPARCSSRSR